jgi:hypothetical protein
MRSGELTTGASGHALRTRRWARRKAYRIAGTSHGPTPGTCLRSEKDACARLESPSNFPINRAAAGLHANDANNSSFDERSNDCTTPDSGTEADSVSRHLVTRAASLIAWTWLLQLFKPCPSDHTTV